MPHPPSFVTHVLDLLTPLGPADARAMFGGWGLRLTGQFFAIIVEDRLFLKVDAQSLPDFQAASCEPFTYPRKDGQLATMGYWSAPDDALETPEALIPWAERGLDAARRAAKPKKRLAAPAKAKAKAKAPKAKAPKAKKPAKTKTPAKAPAAAKASAAPRARRS